MLRCQRNIYPLHSPISDFLSIFATSSHTPNKNRAMKEKKEIKEIKENREQQIKRIRQMERRFDRLCTAVKRLSLALDNYESLQEAVAELNGYYGSEEWRQDFADDEAGLLPDGLKRGVLSEDGIWNLLSDISELDLRLKDVAIGRK